MNPLRLRAVSLIVGALILATACGSGNPSPAAPSPTESNTQAPRAVTVVQWRHRERHGH